MKNSLILFLCLYISTNTHCVTIYPDVLTVEYLEEPLAVDNPNPRLAWILKPVMHKNGTIPTNLFQTAYQIAVASNEDLLKSGKPDLWDTKKRLSDSTYNIQYEGKALKPAQKVFWTVRVWDQNGHESKFANVSIVIYFMY